MLAPAFHSRVSHWSGHQAQPGRSLRIRIQLVAFPGLRVAKPSHDAIRIEHGNPMLLRAPDVNIVHHQRLLPPEIQAELQLLLNMGAFKRQVRPVPLLLPLIELGR